MRRNGSFTVMSIKRIVFVIDTIEMEFSYKNSLHNLEHYFPDIKIVVTLRHPISEFESLYNYKLRTEPGLPEPKETIGLCGDMCDMTDQLAATSEEHYLPPGKEPKKCMHGKRRRFNVPVLLKFLWFLRYAIPLTACSGEPTWSRRNLTTSSHVQGIWALTPCMMLTIIWNEKINKNHIARHERKPLLPGTPCKPACSPWPL